MYFMKGKTKKDSRYILKLSSSIFNILFYVCIAVVMLSIMVSLIVWIVNVPTEEMLLPPYMKKIYDENGLLSEYSINLGNGAAIVKSASDVSLSDIKSVVYGFLLITSVTIAVLIPIFRFLSIIFKAFSDGNIFDRSVYRMVNYIGITTIGSGVALGFFERLVNYKLFKTFVSNIDNVKLKFGLNIQVILIGAIILILGAIIRMMIFEYEKNNCSGSSLVEYEE